MTYRLGLDYAQTQDRDDPLARFRAEFHLPKQANGADEIYFCGNSLGLQPKRTQAFVIEELEKWRRLGVRGHFESRYPWMPYHEFLTAETATRRPQAETLAYGLERRPLRRPSRWVAGYCHLIC